MPLKRSRLWILLIAGVIVLIVFYSVFAISLKIIATRELKAMTNQLKLAYPGWVVIHYNQVRLSPYDYFHHEVHLEEVTLQTKSLPSPIQISEVTLRPFTAFKTEPVGPFMLTLKGITWHGLPAMTITSNYAPATETLQMNAVLDNADGIQGSMTLSHIVLTQNTLQDFISFVNLLDTVTLNQLTVDVSYHGSLSLQEVNRTMPLLAVILVELNLHPLKLDFTLHQQYQDASRRLAVVGNLVAPNMGTLDFSFNEQATEPVFIGPWLLWAMNPHSPMPNSPFILTDLKITYQDQGLVNRLWQYFSEIEGLPVESLKMRFSNNIAALAQSLNLPALDAITGAINAFILKPNTLSLTLHPTEPLTLSMIEDFLAEQQAQNLKLENEIRPLSVAAKVRLIGRYQRQAAKQYDQFLKQVGLTLTAS